MTRTLRICDKGHRYYKSSDCPVCPICANENKPDNFLGEISAPARRALLAKNIHTLEELAECTESEIKALHGVGKNVMVKLNDLLAAENLSFKSKDQ